MKPENRAVLVPASPEMLAQLYCRLHEKAVTPGGLFDLSWDMETVPANARQSWSADVLRFLPGKNARDPFFSHFIERMILLAPRELQQLLCAAMLLSKADTFRRCIDGNKIRHLDAVVGSSGLAAVRSVCTYSLALPVAVMPDWSVAALLGEAYAHIDQVYRGQRQMVLEYLRIALPRELPTLRSDCDEATFERLVRQAHDWYPEFKWLFG